MSRRPADANRRLERRPEREARRPGDAPPPRRQRPSRAQTRGRAPQQMNRTPILLALGAILLIGLIGYAVLARNDTGDGTSDSRRAEQNADPQLPGVYYQPHPVGRAHFGNGVVVPTCTEEQLAAEAVSDPLCYTSNPPASGPHASSPMPFKVLDNPAAKENLVHNMEHGGVVVWFNTDDQVVIDELASIVNDYLDRRRLVVMSQYTEMEPDTIALTAWTRLDKFPVSDFEKKRVTDFIDEHQKRFNPEDF